MLSMSIISSASTTLWPSGRRRGLRKSGRRLALGVRASDVVCRYGGESFLIFLPECDAEEASAKAEALRVAGLGHHASVGGETIRRSAHSFGLAMFPDVGKIALSSCSLRPRALPRKDAGRNRVMVAETRWTQGTSAKVPGRQGSPKGEIVRPTGIRG